MGKKVFELGAHNPSVAVVITRLDRYQGKIKHITAVIEWDDGSSDVVHNEKDIRELCYDSALLAAYVSDSVYNKDE